MPADINYISIRKFVDKARDWIFFLYARKISLAIAILVGGGLGFLIAITSKPSYTGNLTFVLSSDDGSNSNLMALANEFGFSFSNSNNAFAGENILLLFRSKKMFKQALFTTLPGTTELMINRIGRNESFYEKWKKDKRVAAFVPFRVSDTASVGVKDSLVGEIYQYAMTHYFTLDKVEKDLNFYKITVVSHDEDISRFLPIAMVDATSAFYTEIKSSVARRNLQMLNKEADSLKNAWDKNLHSSLAARDQIFNLNTALQQAQAPAKKDEMQVRVLQQTYQTVVQNLEAARITLQKVTPVYHIIDEPELAMRVYKPGIAGYTFTGAVLSLFFFIFFLLLRKTWLDTRL